jgi:hypothetical protein
MCAGTRAGVGPVLLSDVLFARTRFRDAAIAQSGVRFATSAGSSLVTMAEDNRREVSEVVETVSAVGGALAGTAVTLVAGPFVGSASGEAVARVLLRVGHEVEQRFLAPRQERRIGQAFQAATEAAQTELEAGKDIRSDGKVVKNEGATRRKRFDRCKPRNRPDKPNLVATGCHRLPQSRMVRRGSPVRVRKRALKT